MILKELKISTWVGDPTNCYIIFDEESQETMVIDPGGEFEKIQEMLQTINAKVKYIYLTHCHGDHIGAVNQLKNETGAIVLIHRADAKGLTDDKISLATYIGMNEVKVTEFSRVDDGDLIHIGNLEFLVIHTPRTYCGR